MATSIVVSPADRRVSLWQNVGLCLFVLAFFLPAISTGSTSLPGFQCATQTLSMLVKPDTYSTLNFLAALSGLINPFIALYLLFSFVPSLRTSTSLDDARRLIALAILAFMVATWIYFALVKLMPLLGHILWIVGALMILSPEVRIRRSAPVAGA